MKKFCIILFFLINTLPSFSQELDKEDNEIDLVLNELFLSEDKTLDDFLMSLNKYQLLYVSLDYNSDSYFAGRDIGIKQFNIVPQISYLHYSGFFASISGTYYNKFKPKLDAVITTVGYGKSFGKHKNLRYTASYSKYFYANSSDDFLDNSLAVGFSIKNIKKTLGTQISAAYLFGSKDAMQFTSSSFATIKIHKNSKLSLNLKPQLSIIAGKQTIELSRISMIGVIPQVEFYSENIFDILNTQLNIPLELNVKSFDFEIGYNFNFVNAMKGETDIKNTNYFNASVAYLINL